MSAFSLVWSNLFRKKVRTFLTLFSVLVAFLLFTLLRTVAGAFGGYIDIAGVDRLQVSPKYSIIDLMPVTHINEMMALDGVEEVVHATWFGGNYQGVSNFFPKFPVEPRAYFAMYSEFQIDPAQLDEFERNRIGAVAPVLLAEQYGWSVGDRIPIEGDIWMQDDGSRRWEFELVGTYTSTAEESAFNGFLINYDYFNEARPDFGEGQVGWFIVRVSNPDDAAEVAAQIDALFENSMSPTRSATEEEALRQFASQVGDIGLMMNGILSAVFFTILLLTANTMMQAFRERVPELAVLKTVGFTDLSVAVIVLTESILLCVIGGALGIGLAVLISNAISPQIAAFVGSFDLEMSTVLAGFGVAVLLGLVVGLVPAVSARRLQTVDALRK